MVELHKQCMNKKKEKKEIKKEIEIKRKKKSATIELINNTKATVSDYQEKGIDAETCWKNRADPKILLKAGFEAQDLQSAGYPKDVLDVEKAILEVELKHQKELAKQKDKDLEFEEKVQEIRKENTRKEKEFEDKQRKDIIKAKIGSLIMKSGVKTESMEDYVNLFSSIIETKDNGLNFLLDYRSIRTKAPLLEKICTDDGIDAALSEQHKIEKDLQRKEDLEYKIIGLIDEAKKEKVASADDLKNKFFNIAKESELVAAGKKVVRENKQNLNLKMKELNKKGDKALKEQGVDVAKLKKGGFEAIEVEGKLSTDRTPSKGIVTSMTTGKRYKTADLQGYWSKEQIETRKDIAGDNPPERITFNHSEQVKYFDEDPYKGARYDPSAKPVRSILKKSDTEKPDPSESTLTAPESRVAASPIVSEKAMRGINAADKAFKEFYGEGGSENEQDIIDLGEIREEWDKSNSVSKEQTESLKVKLENINFSKDFRIDDLCYLVKKAVCNSSDSHFESVKVSLEIIDSLLNDQRIPKEKQKNLSAKIHELINNSEFIASIQNEINHNGNNETLKLYGKIKIISETNIIRSNRGMIHRFFGYKTDHYHHSEKTTGAAKAIKNFNNNISLHYSSLQTKTEDQQVIKNLENEISMQKNAAIKVVSKLGETKRSKLHTLVKSVNTHSQRLD